MTQVKKQKAPATIKQYAITKVQSAENFPEVQIKNGDDAYKVIRQFWHEDIEIYESFFVLLLNRANRTIGWAKISQGGVTGTIADPKIILKYVVDSLACGVILAHNHPSGNLHPSEGDILVTKKVKEALQYIDSNLIDHLILTPNNAYTSLAEGGYL